MCAFRQAFGNTQWRCLRRLQFFALFLGFLKGLAICRNFEIWINFWLNNDFAFFIQARTVRIDTVKAEIHLAEVFTFAKDKKAVFLYESRESAQDTHCLLYTSDAADVYSV